MAVVFLLETFVPCRVNMLTADSHHVVAAIRRGVVNGFVFAHQHDGNLRSESTERSRIGSYI